MATFPPPVRRPLTLDELGPEPESPSIWERWRSLTHGLPAAVDTYGELSDRMAAAAGPAPQPFGADPGIGEAVARSLTARARNIANLGPIPDPSLQPTLPPSPELGPFTPETTLAEDITRESPPTPEQVAGLRALEFERRPPVRAIRMPGPGNRLTFTNIPGAYPEGEDIGMDRVGGIMRGAEADALGYSGPGVASVEVPTAPVESEIGAGAAAPDTALTPSWARGTNFEGPKFSPTRMVSMDPESETLRGLIRSAARAAASRGNGGGGGGAASPRGALSTGIVGTPHQQARYTMDDLLQASALSSARNEAAVSAMPPLEQARLGNRDVVAGGYRMAQIKPLLDEALNDAMAKLAVANKIPDPTQRQMAIDGIQTELRMKRENISALAAAASGTRGFPFE